MEVTGGEEEGFVREWSPCTHMLNLIPPRVQSGLFSNELCLTCIDAVSEYIALGTNVGLVYWYDRKKGTIQRLRCEVSTSPITYVKIVNTVDYMVGAGNAAGQVTVFQIPKEHPENIPDNFKPKVEPKVERYTIGDLHKSEITAIEWSKNGMRLFSGDKNGVIIMSEIDFYMHLCKSAEIVNEEHEIVQLSWHQGLLLVSSLYRSIICERRDNKWTVTQVGKKERKNLCPLGAVFQYSYARGGAPAAYCARAGLRLWRAGTDGEVLQTLLFKEAISNPLTIAELLNPALKKHSHSAKEYNFGPLYVFRENFLVTHNDDILYILDPRSLTAVAVLDNLRRILSVSVNKDEIFILEGPRSVIRLGHTPESCFVQTDDPVNAMTKSLTSSFQTAVNTVRDQTVPFISSALEQPISLLTKNEYVETNVCKAEECFELPPIKHLPMDLPDTVLQSIITEFKDVTLETEELRRIKSEELEKKLKLYNSMMEKQLDGDLIHSSRRSRRRDGSGASTPRMATPVRKVDSDVYTSPCLMNVSVYNTMPQENDDDLERQIEEKEKILAKMLNLESLSIKNTKLELNQDKPVTPTPKQKSVTEQIVTKTDKKKPISDEKPVSDKTVQSKLTDSLDVLLPKLVKLPNNWNLDSLELKLDLPSKGFKNGCQIGSPDDNLESEWEFV